VDDNDMNLFVFENLLKKTQVKVTKCGSGESCLELVCEKKFDAIFLDHMMPGMDGIETMKQMREMDHYLSKGAPVIALTANAIVGVREMYISEGFDDYLSKPIAGDDLEEMLQRYIPKEKLIRVKNEVHPSGEEEKGAKEVRSESESEGKEDGIAEYTERLVDRTIGLRYCAESEEMYREFMMMFCDMMPEKKEKIKQCFSEQDWENYTILVHALKSTALNVGAKILSEKALASEKAGKAQQIDFILEHHEELMECYEKTVQEGRQMFV